MSLKSMATPDDAPTLLIHSQGRVRLLLERYAHLPEEPAAPTRRGQLMLTLCGELAVHLRVQEEMLFPRLRERLDDAEPLDRAEQEHNCLRELIEQLLSLAMSEPLLTARMDVLCALTELRFKHELRDLYPLILDLDPAWADQGQRLAQRRQELLSDFAHCHRAYLGEATARLH